MDLLIKYIPISIKTDDCLLELNWMIRNKKKEYKPVDHKNLVLDEFSNLCLIEAKETEKYIPYPTHKIHNYPQIIIFTQVKPKWQICNGYQNIIKNITITNRFQTKMQEMFREQKQKYLRQNILESQHDPEQFMDYCQTQKGSIDIDSWSLQELKQIVKLFINSKKSLKQAPFDYKKTQASKIQNIDWDNVFQSKPPQPQPLYKPNSNPNPSILDLDFQQLMGQGPSKLQNQPLPPIKIQQKPSNPNNNIVSGPDQILSKMNNKNDNFISAFNSFAMQKRQQKQQEFGQFKSSESPTHKNKSKTQPIDAILVPVAKESSAVDQHFKSSIKCRTFANKPRLDGQFDVAVTGHEVVNPNPFVPNYVLYSLTTNPLGAQVKRRLKDFQMLRNILKKIFPTIQIPYFQRYGRRLSQTQPQTIRKQKLFLESFLNNLMMNKALRCKILDDFLLCTHTQTLKKIFRQLQKLDRPKSIQQLYYPQGKAQINFSSQNKKYVSQQQLYFDYLQPNLVKLKQLYDQLANSLANNVKIINQISDLYDNLRDSTKNVNNLVQEQLKLTQLEVAFDKISDLHKHWALSIKTQAKVLQVQVRHLCRYETSNLDTIRDICKVCNNLLDTYSKRNDKIQASKQQYEYNKKLNDYKKNVQQASKSTTVLRYQAGHYLHSTVTQINRYLSQLSQKLMKKFKIFSSLQLSINTDLQTSWKQFQTYAQNHPK